ncbi:hypothetical protein SLEP1_g15861 [Rubroshorea leprosula]|uniref:Uncharacterized protein n=1 Tax=Rubroshorea leprosula TaxID=152421 RepID=A0AAV5IY71_9ROSI|nr:hypothetical protein SLEP1_g15861 [Rubroshorea leprosula]
MDFSLCNIDGDLDSKAPCFFFGARQKSEMGNLIQMGRFLRSMLPDLLEPKLEVMKMVPIMRLRKTKRTEGVHQLKMESRIEGTVDSDSSTMAAYRNCRLGMGVWFMGWILLWFYMVACDRSVKRAK